MELPLELLALYLGIVLPLLSAIIVFAFKSTGKLNSNTEKIDYISQSLKNHGLESKLDKAELENLKIKIAMIEKDIEFMKHKIFGTGSPI